MIVPVLDASNPTIVVVGGGFAGVDLVRSLPKTDVNIVVVDRHNYHSFQPLLYQVATGGLDAGSIAYPLRKVFRGRSNVVFRMAEVIALEPVHNSIVTTIGEIKYDYLVLALGSETNYFGNEEAQIFSFPLKTVPNAIDLRSSILLSLEKALSATEERDIHRYTTFVIVGGGATGVELAGALSELRRVVIPSDYPELKDRGFRILLVEGGDHLLGGMTLQASLAAENYLKEMGVEVILDCRMTSYDGETATLANGQKVLSDTLIWAAGVKGRLVEGLKEEAITKGSSRVKVDAYNRVEGYSNVFAIGDLASMRADQKYPEGHPQVAPVAKQQGAHLAHNLKQIISGLPPVPFRYLDKGALAVIGRNKAVADFRGWHAKGFVAWFLWLVVHIFFLAGFRNRVMTLLDWTWNYISYDRFVRLILRPVKRPAKTLPTRA